MMKKLLFTLLLMTTGLFFMAQSAGDYQSVVGTELEWQDNATWLTWNDISLTWEPASDYPTFGGTDITYTVTIQSGSDVIFGLDDPYTLNIGNGVLAGEILIDNGGVLTGFITAPVEFVITDTGTVTVNGSLHCTGDIINNGEMTVNGTYTNATP